MPLRTTLYLLGTCTAVLLSGGSVQAQVDFGRLLGHLRFEDPTAELPDPETRTAESAFEEDEPPEPMPEPSAPPIAPPAAPALRSPQRLPPEQPLEPERAVAPQPPATEGDIAWPPGPLPPADPLEPPPPQIHFDQVFAELEKEGPVAALKGGGAPPPLPPPANLHSFYRTPAAYRGVWDGYAAQRQAEMDRLLLRRAGDGPHHARRGPLLYPPGYSLAPCGDCVADELGTTF
jgi:hypothetical protein